MGNFELQNKILAGEYNLTMPLGKLGFGEAYRATDHNGKKVRVEVTELGAFPSCFFGAEGNLHHSAVLSHLNHQNIVRMIDEGEDVIGRKKYVYQVFEPINGESFSQKLERDGPMSPYAAIPFILELLDGLDYLHNCDIPIVHNSISPSSVYISYSKDKGNVVLGGFEQSRTIKESKNTISIKDLSVFNAAPELLNGIFITHSDLFSVGTILYQMVFGVPPWFDRKIVGRPSAEVKKALEASRQEPPVFGPIGETIDEYLRLVILKALSPQATERFETAEEFATALNRETSIEILLGPVRKIPDFKRKEKQPGTGFDRIAGMHEVKSILYDDVIRALTESDLYARYGITIPNGLLLFGPPGCGKTFISENFAEEIGYNFISIKPSDLQSRWVNATQENIGELFLKAEENAPSIIFIDELDAVVPDRNTELNQMHASAVNEFLARMSNCGEKGIFVIGATNRPEKIDPAVLRTGRFDRVVYVPPPDKEARQKMFELYLNGRPFDLAIDYEELADLTANYVSSDLKFIVDEASRKAIKSEARITMEMFRDVIIKNPPSVTRNEIKKCDQIRKEWELARDVTADAGEKVVGFIRQEEG